MKILISILFALGSFAFAEENLMFGGLSVPKGIFDPPPGWKDLEKKQWYDSNCRWRIVKLPELAGMAYFEVNEAQCFAEARFMFIQLENKGMVKPENKQYVHQEMYAIFDSHTGFKEVCKLVPLKDNYDFFPEDAMSRAMLEGPEAMRALVQKLDENLHLECAMM